MAQDKEQFVTSLARGITVLKALGVGTAEMTLSEVAEISGLSPAAARRFLLTFIELGYVYKVNKHFVLTPKVMELSAGFLNTTNVSTLAAPHLRKVQDATGDSVSLTVLDGTDIVHLCHVPSRGFIQFGVTTTGTRVPAHVSASGQALLALQPEEVLARYFADAELVRFTARTLTDETRLRERFAEVRMKGYAFLVDELDLGVTAIGVALLIDGRAVAGVSCATRSGYTADDELINSRLPVLQQAATTLRAEIQGFPPLLHSLVHQND
jgi:IclR family transcriptional regulator, pca regulon regulatory protein